MSSKEVIYQTPTGEKATGYIIDGRTYKDREGTNRVDVGSVVPTDGGTFVYTANGGVLAPQSVGENLKNAYSKASGSLGNMREASVSGIDAATNKKLANINDQRRQADDRYKMANQQAYRAYLSAANPYGAADERMAKLGLADSGYAESSKMKLASAYQSELSENAREKAEYLGELDRAYREAIYDGDIQKANAIAEYEKLVYQHGINEAEAMANQQMSAYEAGIAANESMFARALQERKFEAERGDVDWEHGFREKEYTDQRGDVDWEHGFREKEYADQRGDVDWEHGFREKEYADQRGDVDWEHGFRTQEYADSRNDIDREYNFRTQEYNDSRTDTANERSDARKAQEDSQKQMVFRYILDRIDEGKSIKEIRGNLGMTEAQFNAFVKEMWS